MEPSEALVLQLFEPVAVLKRLPRMGWLLAGVPQPESVADHTCATALIAYFLADHINRSPQDHGLMAPLEPGRVVLIALVHDLAESALTDLPKRATRLLGGAAKHAAEESALSELLGTLEPDGQTLALWQEYNAAQTPEARLVRDADKLDLLYQALAYEWSGQQRLGDFWQGYTWQYAVSARLQAAMHQMRGRPLDV